MGVSFRAGWGGADPPILDAHDPLAALSDGGEHTETFQGRLWKLNQQRVIEENFV
jgi:hypothetical protein